MALGMAFVIMDDALDYSASAAQMGKNAGDDIDQKITLPVILACGRQRDERGFWQRTLGEADFRDGDRAAQAILARHDAVNRSMRRRMTMR